MNLKILFLLLCICILFLIVIKLYKVNEMFISNFDDVMDNKCLIVTNNQKDNYVFNRGVCEKNTCPLERCSYLRLDTRTGYNHYMSELAPKYSSNDADGNFMCITKESLPDKIYCETMPPVCEYLGAEDYCIDYVNNSWERKDYKKVITPSGDCVWKNKSTDENIDGSLLEDCRKTPLNCAACNVACPVGFNKYQTYTVNSNIDEGIFCEQDENVCGEGCEPLSKTGYKLNSADRQFEPILFRQQMMRNSACLYVHIDQYGDEYCHPDHKGKVYTNYECQFHNDIVSELSTEIRDCYQKEYKWCCNLDNRDFFEKTKYEPIISVDGTKCVYRTVDRSLSKELDLSDVNGFNCPGYEFRLCQNPNEFRNVFEQKCTSCPDGYFMRDNTQMTEYDACAILPDCSSNIDHCFENINETGTIQKKVGYQQQPQIQYSADGGLNTAACVSTTPSDCIRDCNKPPLPIEIQGIFCDLCATTDNPELEINPHTLQCDTKIPCETSNNLCLDRRFNTFYTYTLGQDDEFSPCVYKKVGNETDILQPFECSQECPPNYVRNGDKCEIPKCNFRRTVTITGKPDIVSKFNSLDADEKNTIFEQIDTNDTYRYHEDYCKINTIQRTVELNSDVDTTSVCKITPDSEILPEAAHLIDQNQIYALPFTVNVQPREKEGAKGNDCPSDCAYANPVFNGSDHDVCIDKRGTDKERRAYGRGENQHGTYIKTSIKTENHNRFGTTCDDAKTKLFKIIRDDVNNDIQIPNTYKLNDKGDRLEFSYLCDLPPKDINCEFYEICSACTDNAAPCHFKKTCNVIIEEKPHGNGTPCPTNLSEVRDCSDAEASCPNCEEVSYWDISDHAWANIQPLPNEDKTFNRYLKTNKHCLYNNSIKGLNETIMSQTLSVSRPALSETEITNACDDSLYDWSRPLNDICSCYNEDTDPKEQTGELKSDIVSPEVRGLSVSCPETRRRTTTCESHYTSQQCDTQRTNIDQALRDEQTASITIQRNLNSNIQLLDRKIIEAEQSVDSSIITAANAISESSGTIYTNITNKNTYINSSFHNLNYDQKTDETKIVEYLMNDASSAIDAINGRIRLIDDAIAAEAERQRLAAEAERQRICSNSSSYNFAACPVQTRCGVSGLPITGVLKSEYSSVTCPSPLTQTCPSTHNCNEIFDVNKEVNGYIVTINSITIANSESMTSSDLNNLYLQVALMKDNSWISDIVINAALTIDNVDGHHIIELNSNDWDITNGTIQHNTPGAFTINVSEPGDYKLYMGFTRKNSNNEYMYRDGGLRYRGIVEDKFYPFTIEQRSCDFEICNNLLRSYARNYWNIELNNVSDCGGCPNRWIRNTSMGGDGLVDQEINPSNTNRAEIYDYLRIGSNIQMLPSPLTSSGQQYIYTPGFRTNVLSRHSDKSEDECKQTCLNIDACNHITYYKQGSHWGGETCLLQNIDNADKIELIDSSSINIQLYDKVDLVPYYTDTFFKEHPITEGNTRKAILYTIDYDGSYTKNIVSNNDDCKTLCEDDNECNYYRYYTQNDTLSYNCMNAQHPRKTLNTSSSYNLNNYLKYSRPL